MEFTKEDSKAYIEENIEKIERLRKTVANLATIKNLKYYLERIEEYGRADEDSISIDRVMELDAFFTALVISYGRLFSESDGARRLKKKLVPVHLREAHDEIIALRNKRYAHHDNHHSTAAELELIIYQERVSIKLHWRATTYSGIPPHWRELFVWIDEFVRLSIKKQLEHLSRTSGKEWPIFEPEMALEKITVDESNGLKLGSLLLNEKAM